MGIEQLLGKTSCFETCTHEHSCFGGFLHEEPGCDRETTRIAQVLEETPGVTRVQFDPQNIKGLHFLFLENGTPVDLKLDKGIIQREK
jgi:hypothetical protein